MKNGEAAKQAIELMEELFEIVDKGDAEAAPRLMSDDEMRTLLVDKLKEYGDGLRLNVKKLNVLKNLIDLAIMLGRVEYTRMELEKK